MRTIYLSVCFAVLLMASCSNTTQMPASIQKWSPQQSGTTNRLVDVYFEDAFKGYAVGDSGTLVQTTDAGTTWNKITLPTSKNLTCYIVDGGIHYIAGDSYVAHGTSVQSLLPLNVDNNIWVGRPSHILKATDKLYCFGGSFAGNSTFGSVQVWDSQSVSWISKRNQCIYDGLPGKPVVDSDSTILLPTRESMDLGPGIAAVYRINTSTWKQDTLWVQREIFGVNSVCKGLSRIIGVGRDKIIISTNNGVTWSQQGTPSGFELNDVAVLSSTLAYACGNKGAILSSTDGGLTWSTMESGTTQDLYRMVFTDANTGYIVGSGGTILKLSIGGN